MTPEDKQFLEDNRHHHETLVKAFYLRSLSGETRSRMQDIIRKYWQPMYNTDLWCGPCIAEMIKLVYRLYDDWLAAQPKEEIKEEPKEPEPAKPQVVKAVFPSHKKHHRR